MGNERYLILNIFLNFCSNHVVQSPPYLKHIFPNFFLSLCEIWFPSPHRTRVVRADYILQSDFTRPASRTRVWSTKRLREYYGSGFFFIETNCQRLNKTRERLQVIAPLCNTLNIINILLYRLVCSEREKKAHRIERNKLDSILFSITRPFLVINQISEKRFTPMAVTNS